MAQTPEPLRPGQRVEVIQQIPQRDEVWTIRFTGTVQSCEQQKTGSWFAHGKDNRLWLDRLILRKDDGEIVVCNLDRYTHVQILSQGSPKAKDEPAEGQPDAEAPSATS